MIDLLVASCADTLRGLFGRIAKVAAQTARDSARNEFNVRLAGFGDLLIGMTRGYSLGKKWTKFTANELHDVGRRHSSSGGSGSQLSSRTHVTSAWRSSSVSSPSIGPLKRP